MSEINDGFCRCKIPPIYHVVGREGITCPQCGKQIEGLNPPRLWPQTIINPSSWLADLIAAVRLRANEEKTIAERIQEQPLKVAEEFAELFKELYKGHTVAAYGELADLVTAAMVMADVMQEKYPHLPDFILLMTERAIRNKERKE